MRKIDEVDTPNSCWNKASTKERLFILMARDPAAPATIRFWVKERIKLEKNFANDLQIKEALECADLMEQGK